MSEQIRYKVYMLGAISGEDGPKTKDYRALMGDTIKELGHELLTPHIAYDFEQTTFREKIGGLDNIYGANISLLNQANLVIGEVSGASDGRGYEVAYALHVREIPVLLFRHQKYGRGTNMYWGNSHPLLYCENYDEATLKVLLEQRVQEVAEMVKFYNTWGGLNP